MDGKPLPAHPALSLEHLRSFVAVAEERHFGRAAQRLRLTQPPLSRQVQKLERDVGARLLDRTPHGVELTDAGRAFLPDARRLLALAEAAIRSVRRAASGGAGELAVGFTPLAGLSMLGSVLDVVDDARAGVRLALRELPGPVQLDLLRTGVLDLALVRPPVDPRAFESRGFRREALVLAAPAGHPLAGDDAPLPAERLAGAPLLGYLPAEARYLAQLVAGILEPVLGTAPGTIQGTDRHQVSEQVGQVHTMVALVAAGRGLAVVPASARRLGLTGVAFRTLLTEPPLPVELRLAWRRDATNPALLAVLPALCELCPEAPAPPGQ
jgi:DNA-binding transcriptional LysR family regulator